jgi:hypothetical protein
MRCYIVLLRDSFPNLQKTRLYFLSPEVTRRTEQSHTIEYLFLRMQFVFTLYFTGHILVDLY